MQGSSFNGTGSKILAKMIIWVGGIGTQIGFLNCDKEFTSHIHPKVFCNIIVAFMSSGAVVEGVTKFKMTIHNVLFAFFSFPLMPRVKLGFITLG